MISAKCGNAIALTTSVNLDSAILTLLESLDVDAASDSWRVGPASYQEDSKCSANGLSAAKDVT